MESSEQAIKLWKAFKKVHPDSTEFADKLQSLVCDCCHLIPDKPFCDIFSFYADLDQQHDGFKATFIKLRDEFESRDVQSMVRAGLDSL